jgi:hypothetical protein
VIIGAQGKRGDTRGFIDRERVNVVAIAIAFVNGRKL